MWRGIIVSNGFLLTLWICLLLLTERCISWNLLGRRRSVYSFGSLEEARDFFMAEARKEASVAGMMGEVPIGAVLVKRHADNHNNAAPSYPTSPPSPSSNNTTSKIHSFEIIARAGNGVESLWDASAHAEMRCLRRGGRRLQNWRLENTTLYSTLEPCPMCLAACQAFRVPSLVYGAPDLRLGAVETHMRLLDYVHPFHNVTDVRKGVGCEESAGMLRAFFRERRLQGKRSQNTNGSVLSSVSRRLMVRLRRRLRS